MIKTMVLGDMPGVRHGFFTREGGVSEGIYASLNCGLGSKDAPENVRANRARVVERLGMKADSLVTVHQCHTDVVAILTGGNAADQTLPEAADALVTTIPGQTLGILTADCAPVLFVDSQAGVIAAAHSGWRGALTGVLDNTVAAMVRNGARASRIVAAIGPCIQQRSYEVGQAFPAPFLAEDSGAIDCFATDSEGRFWFDLPRYVTRRLTRASVGYIERADRDTCSESDQFFSYRRSVQRQEPDYGRMLSVIALEP